MGDVDFERCVALLKKAFPEVPSKALAGIQVETIHWYYLR